ncbi:helix-turn-helix domain-containing protein [Rhodococcus sp. T2V]|uniref:helix-turn-helix domain-containing protein n=1 Tax=Rhodococcus sp. T2V TaxID=3034164 RepID=UPI0023E340FD|nr:helix-turn-helix domain-containing protein [Rhodococcus sp. T2V]MDF3306784.1 helix-turn-helix domain-containing protein [Rhodococcus sp. T2V]
MSLLPPPDGDLVDSACPDCRSADTHALPPFPQPATATPQHRCEIVRTTALGTWIDTIRDTFVALDIAPAEQERFTGTVHTRHFAHLVAADVTATSQSFRRTSRLTNLHPLELMQIGMVVAGEGQLIQDGRTCTLGPGDFALYESSRPFTWNLRPEWHLRVFTWPRAAVSLTESQSQELTARTVRSTSPVGQLLSPMLSKLLAAEGGVSSAGAAGLAGGLADLAITAAQEEYHSEDPDAGARDLYLSMVRYIGQHLDDPDLSPSGIAQAFFVSTRTVHRVFARFDATAAATIREHRLEACRQAMVAPRNTPRSLTDIVTHFGFVDLSVFSRAFTATYGISPSRYREQHR